MKTLKNIDSLNDLPKKVQNLLLKFIQNFDRVNCDNVDEIFFVDDFTLSSDLCSLFKYFFRDDQIDYLLLRNAIDDELLRTVGYNVGVAYKYQKILSNYQKMIWENEKIHYPTFCERLHSFDCYFHEFKGASSIPGDLSCCLQILSNIFWDNSYKYSRLKLKINRKIRLILKEYEQSTFVGIPEKSFGDEEYADSYERNFICNDNDLNYKIFADQYTYAEMEDDSEFLRILWD